MSQVFRVERTKNYTVMANYHLKDKRLSLKAKGLLSVMLSLPDDWNYNMKGLARLSKDGLDSVRSTVNELERYGYVTRHRIRTETGQLADTEYLVQERPLDQEEQPTALPTGRLSRTGESVDRRSQRRFSQYWRSQHYKRLMVLKNLSIKYPSYQSLHSINNESINWV